MSSYEPQPEDGCSTCGRRVKPGHGECAACLHGELPDAPRKPKLPRIVCFGWVDTEWKHVKCLTHVIQEGEPGGLIRVENCARCGALEAQARSITRARAALKVRAQARRGFHLDPSKAFDDVRYDAE